MWLEKGHGVTLRNHSTGEVFIDKLFQGNTTEGPCNSERKPCIGSRMTPRQVSANYIRSKNKVLQQAKEFLDEYFRSLNKFGSEDHVIRLLQVHQDIEKQGKYDLTFEELEFGVRLAWRNAPRCIARIQWTTLKLFDARHVETAEEMFDSIIEHIVYATNQGRIRSTITIFPPRQEGKRDFRIWNSQLISYAAYRHPDGSVMGDPVNLDFTELCLSLGWNKIQRSQFDILPLVLEVGGHPPKVFDLPEEVVLRIPLTHPCIPSFDELGLQWYALPAVANMLFDCGGIQFPAAPFNGWYMSTEIGARDLCDAQRYNLSETIAKKLQIDTTTNATLWKDTVILETTKAVLHSYQKNGVTFWDHHTASESFMQFYASEMKTRGGCPADWIWLVPPMSSSSSPLFHQEMAFYFLKPSFEYQTPAYLEYRKTSERLNTKQGPAFRKKKFRSVVIAVRFYSSLYLKSLSKRPKLIVLYASQSGKAEKYANVVFSKMSLSFQANIACMADYNTSDLKSQEIIIAIASTFGDGEPPTNGKKFMESLQEIQRKEQSVETDLRAPRFAVFGLGSKAYPKFCAFAKYLDETFEKLGGHRFFPLECADELNNQEKTFVNWQFNILKVLCDTYKSQEKNANLNFSIPKPAGRPLSTVARFILSQVKDDIISALSHVHRNQMYLAEVVEKTFVDDHISGNRTVFLQLSNQCKDLDYQPGDHLVVAPRNDPEMVQRFTRRVKNCPRLTSVSQLQVQGHNKNWEPYKGIPPCSFETLLSHLIDLTSPPSQSTLQLLATVATDRKETQKLQNLAQDYEEYQEWVSKTCPNIIEVLEDFSTIEVDAASLIGTLSVMQPRYYSISSCGSVFPNEVHVTASLVRYSTQDGSGRIRRGLCTSYMESLGRGERVMCFTRPTPSFRLPPSPLKPLIWIASGSGIAPYRGFWQQRCHDKGVFVNNGIFTKVSSLLDWKRRKQVDTHYGSVHLYYGCRRKSSQVFRNEIEAMVDHKVISKVCMAYSRENEKSKVYVQDLLWKDGARLCKLILKEEAYIYVCGGSNMVSQVEETLLRVILHYGKLNSDRAKFFFTKLKVEGRFKVDMFGTNINH